MSTAHVQQILGVSTFRRRFQRLKAQIADDPTRVIPWLGAGMSKPFGLKLWREFLAAAAEELVPDEKKLFDQLASLPNVDLALVAEFLHSRLGKILHQKVLDEFNRAATWEPQSCVIPWLGVEKVITTNYDRVLDSLLPWLAPVSADTAAQEYRNRRCLIKLHGRVDIPNSIVLSTSQYVKAYTSEFWNWLTHLSRERTLLFIGCSLVSDVFLDVISAATANSSARHFAIIPTSSEEESRARSKYLSDSYGIETISYHPDIHGHGVVRELINDLTPPLATSQRQIDRITEESELELAMHRFGADERSASREDKIACLSLLLNVAQRVRRSSSIHKFAFEKLIAYCDDPQALRSLLENAEGDSATIQRVLEERERRLPARRFFDAIPSSTDKTINEYYRAFCEGSHDVARDALLGIEKRRNVDNARIAVLILQNELYAGHLYDDLIKDFNRKLASAERRSQYLRYGLGLYNLWCMDIDRAMANLRAGLSSWKKRRSGFVFWYLSLCSILKGNLYDARIQVAQAMDSAFPPLGAAENFIVGQGGAEVGLDPRRVGSKELYALLSCLSGLLYAALSGKDWPRLQSDTGNFVKETSAGDLMLGWLLCVLLRLEGQNCDALKIELVHRTRKSVGTCLVLSAVQRILENIDESVAGEFAIALESIRTTARG